jgi:hypothetical protein
LARKSSWRPLHLSLPKYSNACSRRHSDGERPRNRLSTYCRVRLLDPDAAAGDAEAADSGCDRGPVVGSAAAADWEGRALTTDLVLLRLQVGTLRSDLYIMYLTTGSLDLRRDRGGRWRSNGQMEAERGPVCSKPDIT